MAKLTRKTAYVFGLNAASKDIEQFGSKVVTGTPNYTNDPDIIQALSAWLDGWTSALVGTNNSEYKQDRNAVDYVASYQIAYLMQMGIPEWDSGTTYYTNSYAQYNGQLYISLVDANLNNTPPAVGQLSTYWKPLYLLGSAPAPTRTVLTSGSGTYIPPAGCVRLYVRMIGGGGGGIGTTGGGANGGNTVFGAALTAGGGSGAVSNSQNAAGGVATGGSVNISGAVGGNSTGISSGTPGGNSIFGGAGVGAYSPNAVANTGGGGAAGSSGSSAGGGAGAYLEAIINNPSSAGYGYTVGAGGAGGSGSPAGGAGGSGIIIIDEFYFY